MARQRAIETTPAVGGEILREVMNALSELKLPVTINTTPNEIENPIPFDQDEEHRSYDPRICESVLARARAKRSRVQGISLAFLWQMQSGAFFLGQLRSGGDAFFRAAGAAASWRSSAFAGRDHARSLLTGSEQPRFLARQRGCADADLLFLRVSGTAGIRRGESSAGCGFLRAASCANSSCLTTRCALAEKPDEVLLDFAQSTYDAASKLGKWDRAALEEKKPALHSARQHS